MDRLQEIRKHVVTYLVATGLNKYKCTACDTDHGLIKPILVHIANWSIVELEKRFEVGFELLQEDEADQELFLSSDNPKGRLYLLTRKRRYQTELTCISKDLDQLSRKKSSFKKRSRGYINWYFFSIYFYDC